MLTTAGGQRNGRLVHGYVPAQLYVARDKVNIKQSLLKRE